MSPILSAITKQPLSGDRPVFGALLVLLVCAPLPFALARDWGEALLTGVALTLLTGWCLLALFGRAHVSERRFRQVRWPLVALLVVQFWAVAQAIPWPVHWVSAIDPDLVRLRPDVLTTTLSLDAYHTVRQALLGFGLTAIFFVSFATVDTPRRGQWVLGALVLSGTLQAAYGAFMVLSGLELGFFVEKYSGIGTATGTFVNRNHLAGYLNICLGAGIGLLFAQLRARAEPADWKARLRSALELLLSPKIRLRLYLAIMVVALVLTRSRMGNLAFFTALILTGMAALASQERLHGRAALFFASLLIIDLLILGQWFGLDALVARLEQAAPTQEGRIAYTPALVEYIRTFFWTGSGAGSFYGVFEHFFDAGVANAPAHAHNDYAQFAAEYGLPATTVLGLWVLATGWKASQLLRRSTPVFRGVGFAGLMMVIWLLVHSMVDFNLQIAANAATVMALAGVVWACSSARRREH